MYKHPSMTTDVQAQYPTTPRTITHAGDCIAGYLTDQLGAYTHIYMSSDLGMFETTRCLCLAVRRASRAITREFDQVLRVHGLRSTQFTLLSALHLGGPRSIGDLAEMLSADRTTVTRNLAVAEQHGWVTLRADRNDARSRIAAITARGSRTLEAALPAWRDAQRRLTEAIGEQTAASLRKLAGGPCVMPLPQHPSATRKEKMR
jgi:DNA-binding MarR family transcriptional regulator